MFYVTIHSGTVTLSRITPWAIATLVPILNQDAKLEFSVIDK